MAEENRRSDDTPCATAAQVPIGERVESVVRGCREAPVTTSGAMLERIEQTLDDISAAADADLHPTPMLHRPERHDTFELTIIVPVYNERETLPAVLDRIDEVMPPRTEVIVVDDGSFDGTEKWLASLPTRPARKVIRRRVNHGKGSAVRLAIRHSRGRVVAIQDADLEYDPSDLLGVVGPILDGTADVVYGSRYLCESTDRSFVHRLGNWALTRLSNALTGLSLTDMETCHKAFDGDLLRSVDLRECRFGFEPEITAKIASRGARISEVPVGYQSRGFDEGKKIGWKDGVAALACIWKYRGRS
jgi:glycosyltransferase involved in cell wall biosynthesis